MGFIKKVTGIQGATDAANANAKATEDAAKQSAAAQQEALTASAQAAAQQQAQASQRAQAEQTAADAASTPTQTADVELDPQDATQDATTARQNRRASFGRNYGTGISL